jgi:hypothetical protein
MRSANENPVSDWLAYHTGSPQLGRAAETFSNLGRATGETAADLTMVPWAMRTGEQLGEAAARDPWMQSLPNPFSIAPAEAAGKSKQQPPPTAAPAAPAGPPPDDGLTPEMRTRRGVLIKKQNDDGYLPRAERTELEGINKLSEDYARGKNASKLELEADNARTLAGEQKTWRQRNPAWANALPNYGVALSMGIPFSLATARNAHSFFPGSYAGQMRTAVREAEAARAANNGPQAALREAELRNLLRDRPTFLGHELPAAAKGAASGAFANTEAQMFPDQWDYFNLPEKSPGYERAKNRITDPSEYAKRAAIGMLSGGSGYEIGSYMTPYRNPPYARAQALVDHPFTPVPPATPARVQNRYPPGHPNAGRFSGGWRNVP